MYYLHLWSLVTTILVGGYGSNSQERLVDASLGVNVINQVDVDAESRLSEWRREVPKRPLDDNGNFKGLFDPECSHIYILTPLIKELNITISNHTLKHGNTICYWQIIGTDDCIPNLTCKQFQLTTPPTKDDDDPCQDEYLEVTDGTFGYDKFCGSKGPEELTNGRKLRDFFITLKLNNDTNPSRSLRCIVTCSVAKINGEMLKENSAPQINENCSCGRRVTGKKLENKKFSEFPWMAALVATGTRKPFCGGSLINNQYILTSAHCLKGEFAKVKNINVLLNAHQVNLTDDKDTDSQSAAEILEHTEHLEESDKDDYSYRFTIERYSIHPLFRKDSSDFDVALIKLDKVVDFVHFDEIEPICLPPLSHYLESKVGVNAIETGWSVNNKRTPPNPKLLAGEMEVFSHDECREIYQHRFTQRMLCAGIKDGSRDSCKGDLGGPLISEKSKNVWEQIGVITREERCGHFNTSATYTNIREIMQWVKYISNMEDSVWCRGNL